MPDVKEVINGLEMSYKYGGENVIETLKNIEPMVCRYIMAALLGWYVLSELTQHGEVEERTHDARAAFFGCFFMVMLLDGGGFWG